MFFICLRMPHYIYLAVMSPYVSLLGQFLKLSLFLITLTVLRRTGQVFGGMFLCWDLYDVFLIILLELWVRGRKLIIWGGEVPVSSHTIKGTMLAIWPIIVDADLDHQTEGSICQVYCKAFYLLLIPYSLVEVTISSSHLQGGEPGGPPGGGSVYINYLVSSSTFIPLLCPLFLSVWAHG